MLGLDVKLDTNGLAPQVIAGLINQGLVDYLAIDLKTTPERYPELHPGNVFPEHLLETLRACIGAPVEMEYRTTVSPAGSMKTSSPDSVSSSLVHRFGHYSSIIRNMRCAKRPGIPGHTPRSGFSPLPILLAGSCSGWLCGGCDERPATKTPRLFVFCSLFVLDDKILQEKPAGLVPADAILFCWPKRVCRKRLAPSFLLLRFLCRYKENEVAVGNPDGFVFNLNKGTQRNECCVPEKIKSPVNRPGLVSSNYALLL